MTDHQATSVGALLRETRESKGMTQQEAAGLAGVDPGTLSRFESGQRRLTRYPTAAKLARALGIEVGQLLREE